METISLVREFIAKGNTLLLRARGHSMFPFIRDGDLLTIRAIDFHSVRLGDIIFSQPKSAPLITHRVVQIESASILPYLVTKSDIFSSYHNDPCIYATDLIGKVIAITRGGSTYNLETRSAQFRAVIIAFLSAHLPFLLGIPLRLHLAAHNSS